MSPRNQDLRRQSVYKSVWSLSFLIIGSEVSKYVITKNNDEIDSGVAAIVNC